MNLRLGITAKVTLIFVCFGAVLLAGAGVESFRIGQSALQTGTVSALISAAVEKEAALDSWIEERQADLIEITGSPRLLEDLATYVVAAGSGTRPGGPENAAARAARERLVRVLKQRADPGQKFTTFLVMHPETGVVIAATEPGEEGTSKADHPYFLRGRQGVYAQDLYQSASTRGPALTLAAPFRGPDGQLLGVLAARLNLLDMNTIIRRGRGPGQSHDAFLVTAGGLYATQPRLLSDPAVLRRGPPAKLVAPCLAGRSGSAQAGDDRGVPVIAAYRWLPGRQMCLIVKVDQAEAFALVRDFGRTILLTGFLALLAASALAVGLAHSITGPVRALQAAAMLFAQGGFGLRLPETSGDELGQLTREFNAMVTAISEKETQLRKAAEDLRKGEERYRSLYAAEQQARRTVETLHAANVALTQTLDLDTVLETLLDHLGRLVPYDSANVMLLEEGALAVRAVRGYERWTDPGMVRSLRFEVATHPHLQAILAGRRGVLIGDTAEHPGWESLPGTEYVRNWLGIPLVAGGDVIGLYSVDAAQPAFFTEDHLRQAEAMAAQAAVAVQNARLFEQVRTGRERLQRLSRQMVDVQEEERRGIARELHDEVGQTLTALKIDLQTLQRIPEAAALDARLTDVVRTVEHTLQRVRSLSLDLRPPLLDDLGLVAALRWYADRQAQRGGFAVQFFADPAEIQEEELPPDVKTTCFRVAAEALNNVVRHAGAHRVRLELRQFDAALHLFIRDDGTGFDVQAARRRATAGASLGLLGMEERILLVGGQFHIDSEPMRGTEVWARFPLPRSPVPAERRNRRNGR